jgi:uncharacterized membrane protein YeiB
MYAETFTFFGVLTLILFVFAELGKHKIIGVMASLLLIMLGVWVGLDNITFGTGSTTAITESQAAITDGNTTNTTISKTETLTNTHAPITIPNTPVAFNILLALVLISVGLYGMLFYALNLLR